MLILELTWITKMFHFKLLLLRELKSSLSLKGSYILSLAFFSITIIVLPIGIGPDKNILSLISPGLIWVSLILTSLLSLNSLFHEDYIDGTLDLYKTGPLSFSEIAFVKSLVHWISNFLPLLFRLYPVNLTGYPACPPHIIWAAWLYPNICQGTRHVHPINLEALITHIGASQEPRH